MIQSEIDDAIKEIKRTGLDPNDFQINGKDRTNWRTGEIVPIKEMITVKRISNSKVKIYQAGHATNWVGDFIKDLQNKFFE